MKVIKKTKKKKTLIKPPKTVKKQTHVVNIHIRKFVLGHKRKFR